MGEWFKGEDGRAHDDEGGGGGGHQMIPGMAGLLPKDVMYEGEKKLYTYQLMIDEMEPEER